MIRLRAERDALNARVDVLERRRARRRRGRGLLAVVAVVLACVVFTAALVGVWARRNFLDTDRFVSRAGPLITDPNVQEVIETRLAEQILTLVDPEAIFREVLPERASVLAVPLSSAIESFVADRVDSFVASDAFATLWNRALRRAHETAVKVLRDESDAVEATGGTVTIDLAPAIQAVLDRITAASPEILGREVDIPDVSVDDVPDAVRTRLENRLGRDLDEGFGQITIYDDGKLEEAQAAIRLFDRVVVTSVVVAFVLMALAMWISPRRRRTLLQLAVGIALGMVLLRRVALLLEEDVADLARTPAGAEAAANAIDSFLDPLHSFAGWVLVVLAVVMVLAVATADYPWVRRVRRGVVALATRIGRPVADTAHDDAVVTWVATHRTPLLVMGAGVGLLVLAWADLTWLGTLLVLAVLGAYALVIHRLGGVSEIATPGP